MSVGAIPIGSMLLLKTLNRAWVWVWVSVWDCSTLLLGFQQQHHLCFLLQALNKQKKKGTDRGILALDDTHLYVMRDVRLAAMQLSRSQDLYFQVRRVRTSRHLSGDSVGL